MTAHGMCGRFEIFESARHFRIEFESGRPIRILIEYRSFAGPYCNVMRAQSQVLNIMPNSLYEFAASTTQTMLFSVFFCSRTKTITVEKCQTTVTTPSIRE